MMETTQALIRRPNSAPTTRPAPVGTLQRKCACGGTPDPSGECAECRKKRLGTLQRAAGGPAPADFAPSIVHEVLRSSGKPLDAATRRFMEPRLGHDFSRVRVHTDERAAESARAVNALAYTVGSNVVFAAGRYAPQTHEGRKLIAHELTHTLQQAASPSAGVERGPIAVAPDGDALERAAEKNAAGFDRETVAPEPGAQALLQRSPADDKPWSRDVVAARTRGRLMAERIRRHGKLSREARAKINRELASLEGPAHDAYIAEVRPILQAVTEIEMPEVQARSGPLPPRITDLSMVPVDPRQISDEQIYATQIEAARRDLEELEQARHIEIETLREKTKGWGADQAFAISLLEPILKASVNPDRRAVSDAIRKPILDRYEVWLRAVDERLQKVCQVMPGGLTGVILKTQAGFHPSLDPCRRWFKDDFSHGPQELYDLEARLKITRGAGRSAAEEVYWGIFEYRKKTDPLMLQQEQMAGEMVSGISALGGAPAGLSQNFRLILARGGRAPRVDVEGVAFGQVAVSRQGSALVVEYTFIENVDRVPGQGRAMHVALEDAAVQVARDVGAAEAQVRVHTVINQKWIDFLQSRGFVKTPVDVPGTKMASFPFVKVISVSGGEVQRR